MLQQNNKSSFHQKPICSLLYCLGKAGLKVENMEDPLLNDQRELSSFVGQNNNKKSNNTNDKNNNNNIEKECTNINNKNNHMNIPSQLRFTVVNAAIGAFCFGYNTASIAGAELYLDKDAVFWNSSVASKNAGFLTDWKKGILVSCILLSGCVGALLASPVYNKIGSRGAHTLQNIFFIFGPIIMAFANSFWILVAARIFTGFGVGINSSICNLYISEISPTFCRGQLGGYGAFSVTAGILFAYIFSSIVGAQIDSPGVWRIMLGIGSIPAIFQVMLSTTCCGLLSESPRWLKSKDRFDDARKSLKALGLEQSTHHLLQQEQNLQQPPHTRRDTSICNHKSRSALIAGIGINVLQQVCGINVVIYFGPQILKNAGFQDVASIALSAGVSIAQLGAILVLMRLVDRVGRKPLAMIGIAMMIIGLAIIAVAFYILAHDATTSIFAPWLAVLGMLLFRIAFSLSLGPMPYIVTSELFTNAFRSKGVAISWAANWISNFGVTLSFPILKDLFASIAGNSPELGSVCLFGIYILMSIFAAVFIWKYVPETAGKDFEDSDS